MTDEVSEERELNNPGSSTPFLMPTNVRGVKYLIAFSHCVSAHAHIPIKEKEFCTPYASLCYFSLLM